MTGATFVLIAVVSLAIIAVLVFLMGNGRRDNRLTPLAAVAFGFVISGIVLGDNRAVGYSLMGVGVALAIADIIVRRRG